MSATWYEKKRNGNSKSERIEGEPANVGLAVNGHRSHRVTRTLPTSVHFTYPHIITVTMPAGQIPAITGKLRKRLILDLSVAMGGGVAAAYAYWYGLHLPSVQRRDNYYAKLQAERANAGQ
ncbi:unnamed protein product [Jaminaea pallidilutea]